MVFEELSFINQSHSKSIEDIKKHKKEIEEKEEIKENVITVFPDDSKKYLSTELSQNLDLNPCMISNQIQLIDYEII
mgnify:CR=1 FL=1